MRKAILEAIVGLLMAPLKDQTKNWIGMSGDDEMEKYADDLLNKYCGRYFIKTSAQQKKEMK